MVNMWWEKANCQGEDPDMFFPEYNIDMPMRLRMSKTEIAVQEAMALSFCRQCSVVADCLADGIADEYGIRGGMTATERAVMRRRMRKAIA